jgi:hypothetical protein
MADILEMERFLDGSDSQIQHHHLIQHLHQRQRRLQKLHQTQLMMLLTDLADIFGQLFSKNLIPARNGRDLFIDQGHLGGYNF